MFECVRVCLRIHSCGACVCLCVFERLCVVRTVVSRRTRCAIEMPRSDVTARCVPLGGVFSDCKDLSIAECKSCEVSQNQREIYSVCVSLCLCVCVCFAHTSLLLRMNGRCASDGGMRERGICLTSLPEVVSRVEEDQKKTEHKEP